MEDRILKLATDLFDGNQAAALVWLNSPARALNYQKPAQVCLTAEGAQEVENLIGRLEHGIIT
jgi:putative toxin-antitoxin system antitoxin component (TIGR02293 family)